MDSLKFLNLLMCSKLKIPEFGEGMKNLSWLLVAGTATEELPSSIEHLVGLTNLHIDDSKSLQSLPGTAIFKLKSLGCLNMDGCPKLKKLVESTGETVSSELPALRRLSSMKRKLMGYTGLFKRKSPEPLCLLPTPRALPSLSMLNLNDCNLCQGVIPDDIGYCFPSLGHLELAGNKFVSLPASIKCLSKLRLINLKRCKRLEQLPELPSNDVLEVSADDCDSLKMLLEPPQQGTFAKLEWFRLTTVNCFGLIDNEGLNNGIFSMLRRLAAQGISPYFFHSFRGGFLPIFDIVSPGSKISDWFNTQSEGDTLTVELHPDRESCTSEWMGIVFCVVFADQKDPETVQVTVGCSSPGIDREHRLMSSVNLRHVMGDHLWLFFMGRGQIQALVNQSHHLWLFFMGCGQIQDTISCSITFSFDMRYDIGRGDYISCSNGMKRCGARVLYEQDLKNLLNGKTNILKRSREYCDSEETEAGEGPSAIASGSPNKESFFKRLKA